jgi:hypothetical protein
MIVRKFISDSHFLPAFVILWAIFIWSDGFVFFNDAKFKVIENPAPFYYFINLLFKGTYLINVIVAFVIVVVQAFMLNNLFTSKSLLERNSYLPSLFYITFMGFSFEMFGITPALFANFFLIIALDKILDVFNEEKVFLEVFNSGLLIGIASMFYFPVFILYLFLIVALAVYFLINLRGMLSSFLGFITPAFFIAVYYYLFDKIEEKADAYFSNIHLFTVFKQDFSPFFYWFWIYVIFFGLIAFYRVFVRYVAGKPVRIRKRFNVLVYFVLIASVSYIFIQDFYIEHFAIMVIAISPVFAVYFQEIRRKFWKESIFTLLIIIILLGKLSRLGYIHFL